MDIPLATITSKATIQGDSPCRCEGESLPGVGGAHLSPVGFAQLGNFTRAQVADWLEDLGYFKAFNSTNQLATSKQEFMKKELSGSVLLNTGFNIDELLKVLSLGKALKLSSIIKKVYHDAGIFPPSFTKTPVLTITQGFSCQVRPPGQM